MQLIQAVREQISARKLKKDQAQRQAFRLSNQLMLLSIRSAEALDFHQLAETPPDQEAPDPPELPEFDFFIMSDEFSQLDTDDLARLADLEFRKEIETSFIRFGWQTWMDLRDIERIQKKRLTYLRDEAEKMAKRVREKHKLPLFGDHLELVRDE